MKHMQRWLSDQHNNNNNKGTVLGYTIRYWMPVLLCAGAIFLASSRAYAPAPVAKSIIDLFHLETVAHLFEYSCLGALLYRALVSLRSLRPVQVQTWAVIMAVAFAFSDEYHQSFVPGRHPRLTDVGIDAVGILTGLAVFHVIRHVRRRVGRDEAVT